MLDEANVEVFPTGVFRMGKPSMVALSHSAAAQSFLYNRGKIFNVPQ
jgi:hypothetical protein